METLKFAWDVVAHLFGPDCDFHWIDGVKYEPLGFVIFAIPLVYFLFVCLRGVVRVQWGARCIGRMLSKHPRIPWTHMEGYSPQECSWKIDSLLSDEMKKVIKEPSERGLFFSERKNDILDQLSGRFSFALLFRLGLGLKVYRRKHDWETPPDDIGKKYGRRYMKR